MHVPVHECIASCLEHALMWYFCHEYFPNSSSRVLPRRGSLHWTDFYHVMKGKTGHVMVTPAPSADSQLAWLIEEDAFDDLLDPEYQEPGRYRSYHMRMMDVLRDWVSKNDARELFEKAQERHLPWGIVNHIEDVAGHAQLNARDWWQEYEIRGRKLKGAGAPYQFGKTPVGRRESSLVDDLDSKNVVEAVGWSE